MKLVCSFYAYLDHTIESSMFTGLYIHPINSLQLFNVMLR
jgi:hypothetical protein